MKTTSKAEKTQTRQAVCVCVLLALAVLAVFGQTARFEFVHYDDGQNVFENLVVQQGLSVKAVGWAFTHAQVCNWIPLTTLSHMLDCQIFGLRAGGHHLVNVLLHAATAILLFLVLRQMTGSLWRSAFVAAVFAVHPLRAESVAWVSERKDVLSGMFFMLAIGAYARYVENRKASSFATATVDTESRKRKFFYALALVFFALGLLAKSMVATLPLVLLLLDYWPLGRMKEKQKAESHTLNGRAALPRRPELGRSSSFALPHYEISGLGTPFWGLVKEKIPLFALSAGSCVATALVPGLMIQGADRIPLFERVRNAVVSYAVYLEQMVFPSGLATPYPNPPHGQPGGKVWLALVLLATITAAMMVCRKKRPYLLAGWLWYLGMLFPVIGIIQISADAAHADRYTYLPEIGLAMGLTWAVAEGSAGWKHRRPVLCGLMIAVVGALTVCGRIQTAYWKDDPALWARALHCAPDNRVASNNLGMALASKGEDEAAIAQFQRALEIQDAYAEVHYNLGNVFRKQGRLDEAVAHYRRSLEIAPDRVDAINNLGMALAMKGLDAAAIEQYQNALKIQPSYPQAHYHLGISLAKRGQWDEAILHYRKALELQPDLPDTRNQLAYALFQKGLVAEAIVQYRKALELQPDSPEARNGLGNALNQRGDVAEAIVQYRMALDLQPDSPETLNNLGNALYQRGALAEAILHYRKALDLRPGFPEAHNGLGGALIQQGEVLPAIAQFQQAVDLKPDYSQARDNLGLALLRKGDFDAAMACFEKTRPLRPEPLERWYGLGNQFLKQRLFLEAIVCFRQALSISPRFADAWTGLGLACFQSGQSREAVDSWQKALDLNPAQPQVQTFLASLLATASDAFLRDGPKAVALASQANQATGGANPGVLSTLAAAYAETGRFAEASATARKALALAQAQKDDKLAGVLQDQIKLYDAGLPMRQPQ